MHVASIRTRPVETGDHGLAQGAAASTPSAVGIDQRAAVGRKALPTALEVRFSMNFYVCIYMSFSGSSSDLKSMLQRTKIFFQYRLQRVNLLWLATRDREICELGLQDAGWPMQGNGAQ